ERGIHKVPFEHTATAIAGALELTPAQVDAMRAAIKLTRKTAAFHSIKALTDSRESPQPNRLGMSPGLTILSG
ncbi:MAG TPA: hypothetical protein VFY10_09135, partial [Dehalococcoidia bacterium]|nr:hypothetical protein [Dehalococcoidia bacterium]